MAAAELSDEPAAQAIWRPLDRGDVAWPAHGHALFLGARVDAALQARDTRELVCQQDLRPFADVLERHGLQVAEPAPGARFPLVMVLPPRQREARRALFARAVGYAADDGIVLAAVANHDGARSAQDDLRQLAGPVQHLSKHKCRIFWTRVTAEHVDAGLRRAWLASDALRRTVDGMVSRPGLFAWDRVDPGSALLAAQLPEDLAGDVADLGGGSGYLSVQLIRRCPHVASINLFEADARAIPAARVNLEQARIACERAVAYTCHWHDVAAGLPHDYDHIVSNPPFHQGRADLPQLGRAFIGAAADALRPDGTFWMVANRHLAYEATLRARFTHVRHVVERDGYKVIEARQ